MGLNVGPRTALLLPTILAAPGKGLFEGLKREPERGLQILQVLDPLGMLVVGLFWLFSISLFAEQLSIGSGGDSSGYYTIIP